MKEPAKDNSKAFFRRYKPYPAYKDSGVEWLGDVPEHWEVKQLKFLADISSGFALTDTFNPAHGKYPVYGSNGLIGYSDDYFIRKPTIVVGRVGASGAVHEAPANSWVSDNALVFLDIKHSISMPFLKYVLIAMNLVEKASKNAQPIITGTFVKMQKGSVPYILEQEIVANYLRNETSKIDALIANHERLIELLQEKRAALITHAVTKGLDPSVPMKDSGVEWLGKIPQKWNILKLKHLVKSPLQYGSNEHSYNNDEESPRYIRITDFSKEGILRDDICRTLPLKLAQDYLLNEGDILFARSGATAGKTFLFKNHIGLACFAGYLIRAEPLQSRVLSKFLYYFTRTNVYELWRNSVFIRSTIENINADKYNNLIVPLPDIAEQEAIVRFIDGRINNLNRSVEQIQRSVTLLKEYRTALISAAVTGKIDVREEVSLA